MFVSEILVKSLKGLKETDIELIHKSTLNLLPLRLLHI